MDLWWSGKHASHGGNVQVIAAPDGWPLRTSPVRPDREHDTVATVPGMTLSGREVAAHLGHARASMTMDRYMSRRRVSDRAATLVLIGSQRLPKCRTTVRPGDLPADDEDP